MLSHLEGFDENVNFFVNLSDGRTCAASVQFYEKLYEQYNTDQPNSTNKNPTNNSPSIFTNTEKT